MFYDFRLDIGRNVGIVPYGFHVFVFFQSLNESMYFEGFVKLAQLDRIGRQVLPSRRKNLDSLALEEGRYATEFLPSRLDIHHVTVSLVIIRSGFHDNFFQSVRDGTGNLDFSDESESEVGYGAGFPKASSALGKGMAHAGSRTVAVVRKGFDDNGNAARTVSFVNDFLDGSAPLFETGTAFDGAVDILVRHVFLLGLVNSIRKRYVFGWISTASSGDGNEFRMDRENFTAFFGGCLFLSFDNGSSSHIV